MCLEDRRNRYQSGTDSREELRVNIWQDPNRRHTQRRINQRGCAHGVLPKAWTDGRGITKDGA